jgi:hypothetical protein
MTETLTSTTEGIREGDVFVESWGYDQTNIDYYQVLKVTATGVRLRKIEALDVTTSGTVFTHRALVPAIGQWVERSYSHGGDAFLSERGAFRKVRRYDYPDRTDYFVDITTYSVASKRDHDRADHETRSEYGH